MSIEELTIFLLTQVMADTPASLLYFINKKKKNDGNLYCTVNYVIVAAPTLYPEPVWRLFWQPYGRVCDWTDHLSRARVFTTPSIPAQQAMVGKILYVNHVFVLGEIYGK